MSNVPWYVYKCSENGTIVDTCTYVYQIPVIQTMGTEQLIRLFANYFRISKLKNMRPVLFVDVMRLLASTKQLFTVLLYNCECALKKC